MEEKHQFSSASLAAVPSDALCQTIQLLNAHTSYSGEIYVAHYKALS